jgi:hypothetical protein
MAFIQVSSVGRKGVFVDEDGRMRLTTRGKAQHPTTVLRQFPKTERRRIRRELVACGMKFIAAQSCQPALPTRHGIPAQ